MTIWFTSDLHFGHEKVIDFCKRPFASLVEMEKALIANWNEVVEPKDQVFVLGDFSLGKADHTLAVRSKLNGDIALIEGNHDRVNGRVRSVFSFVKQRHNLTVEDAEAPEGKQYLVLDHFALLTWDKMHKGAWMLHGHSHGSLRASPFAKRLDVGVDCHNYRPVSYETIKELMRGKEFRAVDGHGARSGEVRDPIEVSAVDAWEMLLSTIRYSMGRQTYMSGYSVDLYERYRDALTPKQKRQIRDEVQRAIDLAHKAGGTLGAACDERDWQRLVLAIDAEVM